MNTPARTIIIATDDTPSGYTAEGIPVIGRTEFTRYMSQKDTGKQPGVNKENALMIVPVESASPEKRG